MSHEKAKEQTKVKKNLQQNLKKNGPQKKPKGKREEIISGCVNKKIRSLTGLILNLCI